MVFTSRDVRRDWHFWKFSSSIDGHPWIKNSCDTIQSNLPLATTPNVKTMVVAFENWSTGDLLREEVPKKDLLHAISYLRFLLYKKSWSLNHQSNRVDSKRLEQNTGLSKNKMERWSHQTDWTLMVKTSQAQTPVGSIQGGVPLSRVNTNPDDDDDDDDDKYVVPCCHQTFFVWSE